MLLAFLLPAAAIAADLDVSLLAPFAGANPVELTFRDVQPGRLPAVTVPAATAGLSYRFSLDLALNADDTYTITVDVAEVATGRAGRENVRGIASPRVTFLADQEASFRQGSGPRVLAATVKLGSTEGD